MIPKYLYRGDSDTAGIRLVRDTIGFFQLQSNLINGGCGREINETNLLSLISKHVNSKWSATHFLSFTESESIANRYGINCEINVLPKIIDDYSECFENSWDFVRITISTELVEWKQLEKGIYEGLYKPILPKFKGIDKYRIVAINVDEALPEEEQYVKPKFNAKKDKEWLILPATKILFNNGMEYSAILDGACISEIKKYKLIERILTHKKTRL